MAEYNQIVIKKKFETDKIEFGALTNQESKLYIQKIIENYREKQLGKILGKILGKTRKNMRIEKR